MKKIGLLFVVLAVCAVAQAGFTSFNCTFDDDPLPLKYHTWDFTLETGILNLHETYKVAYPATDSVNMFASANTDPTVRATKYVTNGTGSAWTGYILTLNNASPGVSFTGVASSDYFSTVVVTANQITYSNGTVGINDEVQLNFRILVADAGDFSWCVTQQAVPEPATICLLGLGGLLLRKRRA